jgi:hypothetical protein
VLSPAERTLRARLAAHALHAQGKTNTGPATVAHLARFEREVDPDGLLPPAERSRRADHARKSYMSKLALKASRARGNRMTAASSETYAAVASEQASDDVRSR